MNRHRLFIITFFIIISFLFTGCWMMENVGNHQKLLEFDLSNEVVRQNEPIDVLVKWCPVYLDDDELFSMKKIDNLEIQLLEGELYKSDANAIFIRFIQPSDIANYSDDNNNNHYPYCKLRLTFKKPGSYELRFKRTKESILDSNFEDGYMYKKIKVQE